MPYSCFLLPSPEGVSEEGVKPIIDLGSVEGVWAWIGGATSRLFRTDVAHRQLAAREPRIG